MNGAIPRSMLRTKNKKLQWFCSKSLETMEFPWVWFRWHTDSAIVSPCEGKKLGYLDFKDFSALVTLQAAHAASARWWHDWHEMQPVEQTFAKIWCFLIISCIAWGWIGFGSSYHLDLAVPKACCLQSSAFGTWRTGISTGARVVAPNDPPVSTRLGNPHQRLFDNISI